MLNRASQAGQPDVFIYVYVLGWQWPWRSHNWTIFTLQPDQDPTVALACNPALVVLDGFNDGRGTPGAGTYRADGTVGPVAHPGPFADVAAGSRMIWRGKVTNLKAGGDEFKATLHIFPLK